MATTNTPSTIEDNLRDASTGYDYIFGDDIENARKILGARDSPFHQMGLGTVIFLQAALGMEEGFMAEATKLLTLADTSVKGALKTQGKKSNTRFPAGTEFEILQADLVLLLGLTQALSESYMGYVKCLYSLNSAHGSFSKIFKRVFPHGLDGYSHMTGSPSASRKPSTASLRAQFTSASSLPRPSSLVVPAAAAAPVQRPGFLSRFALSTPTSPAASGTTTPTHIEPEGHLEEMIFYGAAFGFGMFNLVFSLLPTKIRRVVGFFGYQSDRKLAIQALNVATAGKGSYFLTFIQNLLREFLMSMKSLTVRSSDETFHITLLTYQGVKLLTSGYQANEDELIDQLDAIVKDLEAEYPHGSLWLLNRAKIQRYQNNPPAAIATLQGGLGPSRPVKFVQADALLVFELAWVLIAERRYTESAEMWLKMKTLNGWSHATYTFMAAGCFLDLQTPEADQKAKELLDSIPGLKKDMGGRELPTEVYITRKLGFWKRKQARWQASGRVVEHYADCIRINPAEEFALFWNTHGRIPKITAEAHIEHFLSLTPLVQISTPYSLEAGPLSPGGLPDLDTPDELACRDLILGITHRSAGEFVVSRRFLEAASSTKFLCDDKWITAMAHFELAVLDMREVQALARRQSIPPPPGGGLKTKWEAAIAAASGSLDQATATLGDTDMSSRLESRIAMFGNPATAHVLRFVSGTLCTHASTLVEEASRFMQPLISHDILAAPSRLSRPLPTSALTHPPPPSHRPPSYPTAMTRNLTQLNANEQIILAAQSKTEANGGAVELRRRLIGTKKNIEDAEPGCSAFRVTRYDKLCVIFEEYEDTSAIHYHFESMAFRTFMDAGKGILAKRHSRLYGGIFPLVMLELIMS
ncbi:hypothetical protein FRB98_005433 [Tulasnella sp. 332]|nr:hypothetical protein FRB98_005433 [Tulasnella sp. 332]